MFIKINFGFYSSAVSKLDAIVTLKKVVFRKQNRFYFVFPNSFYATSVSKLVVAIVKLEKVFFAPVVNKLILLCISKQVFFHKCLAHSIAKS